METKQKIIIGVAASVGLILIIILGLFIFRKDVLTTGDTKLTYWGYDNKDSIDVLVNKYKEAHKSITIEYTKKGESPEDYQKILNDALASGEGPDLFQIRNDWLPTNYKKMAVMPNSTYSIEDYKSTFYPVAFEDLSRNNEVYAIPFYIDTLALYFNRSIFETKNVNNPGKTWTDVQKNIGKIRELKGDFVNLAALAMGTDANVQYSEDILYMIMLQNKTEMNSPDDKTAYLNLSQKDRYNNIVYPGANAIDYYSSYAMLNKENYNWNASMVSSLNAFIDGKTSMYFGYSTDRKIIEESGNKKVKYEVSKAPQILGNEVYLAKYWATGVSKASKNQETAWDFLKFSTEEKNLLIFAKTANLPASRKVVAEKQSDSRYMGIFVEQNTNAQSWNKGNWEETDAIIREAINSVYTGKATGQQAVDKAAQKITPILMEIN